MLLPSAASRVQAVADGAALPRHVSHPPPPGPSADQSLSVGQSAPEIWPETRASRSGQETEGDWVRSHPRLLRHGEAGDLLQLPSVGGEQQHGGERDVPAQQAEVSK